MRLRLAEFTSRMVGRRYSLGETDCASLVLEFAKHLDVALPDSWQGYPVAGYAELYRTDPQKAMALFIEWATSAGNEVHPGKVFAGDLMVVMQKGTKDVCLLIHAGQDQGLCVTEKRGVTFVPLRAYDVLKAYRWRDECR